VETTTSRSGKTAGGRVGTRRNDARNRIAAEDLSVWHAFTLLLRAGAFNPATGCVRTHADMAVNAHGLSSKRPTQDRIGIATIAASRREFARTRNDVSDERFFAAQHFLKCRLETPTGSADWECRSRSVRARLVDRDGHSAASRFAHSRSARPEFGTQSGVGFVREIYAQARCGRVELAAAMT